MLPSSAAPGVAVQQRAALLLQELADRGLRPLHAQAADDHSSLGVLDVVLHLDDRAGPAAEAADRRAALADDAADLGRLEVQHALADLRHLPRAARPVGGAEACGGALAGHVAEGAAVEALAILQALLQRGPKEGHSLAWSHVDGVAHEVGQGCRVYGNALLVPLALALPDLCAILPASSWRGCA